MIRSIKIRNFRCYKELVVDDLARLNVIVGDNGSGKTALLEALFLALATSSEVAIRLRQMRGLDGSLGGTAKRIEQELWGDFFYQNDWTNAIDIFLVGDGPEARSLNIARGVGEARLPNHSTDLSQLVTSSPLTFTWTDSTGNAHRVSPTFSTGGLALPDTGEDLPYFYFFSSTSATSSVENATRFSELSKANRHRQFVDVFVREYDWLQDLDVEVTAGAPAIFATIKGSGRKIPLPNASAGINKVLAIMLAITSYRKSVVLVDEIENGIFHSHMSSIWKTLVSLLKEYECQLFVSTHSQECLIALAEASAGDLQDTKLLRTERGVNGATVMPFSGETFAAGIDYGEEVR